MREEIFDSDEEEQAYAPENEARTSNNNKKCQPPDYEECEDWGVDSFGVLHDSDSAGEEVTKPSVVRRCQG